MVLDVGDMDAVDDDGTIIAGGPGGRIADLDLVLSLELFLLGFSTFAAVELEFSTLQLGLFALSVLITLTRPQ